MMEMNGSLVRYAVRSGSAAAVVLMAACGGNEVASRLPDARSALVPPDYTSPCAITRSACFCRAAGAPNRTLPRR